MLPVGLMFQNISPFFGGFLDNVFGSRLVLIIAVVFAVGCHLLLTYFINFWIIIGAMTLFGFGNGLVYYSVMRNCWHYFPEKKGVITGVIIAFYGGSSMIWTTIADAIINPNGDKVTADGYYSDEISKEVPKFLWIMNIIIAVIGVLAIILVFPYKKEEEVKDISKDDILTEGNESTHTEKNESFMKAMCSCQFFTLCFFTGLMFCKCYII